MSRASLMRARRGFTVVEVMTAMAIGAIIAAGATATMVMVYKSTLKLERQANADEDAKLLLDALLSEVQQIGGGTFRPYMLVETENNTCPATVVNGVTLPACTDGSSNSSDRFHYLEIDDSAFQCGVDSIVGNTVNFDLTSDCCDGTFTGFNGESVVVALDSSTDAHWVSRRCTAFNVVTSGTPSCSCTMSSRNGWEPPPPADANDWGSAIATLGKARTIFLDTDNVLKVLTDSDNDGVPNVVKLAPDIHAFHSALVFDADGDNRPELTVPTFAGQERDEVRMVRLGLVVGVDIPSREEPTWGQVLDGNLIEVSRGMLLRSVESSTTLRNLYLFY